MIKRTLLAFIRLVGKEVSTAITMTGCIKLRNSRYVGLVFKPGAGEVLAISVVCEMISQLLFDPQIRF